MEIEEFLKTVVDGYLLSDLENMSTVTTAGIYGALGYSMMATTLAGMELLGSLLLLSADPYDPQKGNKYFLEYWNNYLVTEEPVYEGLGNVFRKLLRHGIAHSFVAKHGIVIEKGSGRRVIIDRRRRELYIDCNIFFEDFRKSYLNQVKPIIDGTANPSRTNVAVMQNRLQSMEEVFLQDANKEFDALNPSLPSIISGIKVVTITPADSSEAGRKDLAKTIPPTGVFLITPPKEK